LGSGYLPAPAHQDDGEQAAIGLAPARTLFWMATDASDFRVATSQQQGLQRERFDPPQALMPSISRCLFSREFLHPSLVEFFERLQNSGVKSFFLKGTNANGY
jgi:hypothetical protein